MIAYKGFSQYLTSVLGNGRKETSIFQPGQTLREESSKTGRSGFHCCENPFECLTYYSMNGTNRFFKVEASGDIDEDESERITCTEITLLEELTPLQLALEGMKYIVTHPDRSKWEQYHGSVTVAPEAAEAAARKNIAIARGKDPKVKGPEGSILGLIKEDENGIVACKLFVQKAELADKWCRLTEERTIREVA